MDYGEPEDYETNSGANYGDMVSGRLVEAIWRAKCAAKRIRDELRAMSPMKKELAKREIAEIALLLEAVEAL